MARATSGMDLNGRIAALLRDFAAIQKSKQSMWGYKRAANAILTLEEPIESLLQADRTLPRSRISAPPRPHIPSCARPDPHTIEKAIPRRRRATSNGGGTCAVIS